MSKRATRRGTGRGVGRPSKGPRYPQSIYFPVELHDEIKKAAAAAEYDALTEYVVDIIYRAKSAGLWPATSPGQERLPISA